MTAMLASLHLLLLLALCALAVTAIDTRQSLAIKGKFFIHSLHSGAFFPSAGGAAVKWTATLKGRPLLPTWLRLIPSRHGSVAYLAGTPVGRMRQLTVHVIAKRMDTFAIAEQFVVVTLQHDPKYGRATHEIVEIQVKNFDVEDLLGDRTGLIGRMEDAVRETFRGKNVNPYIESLSPAIQFTTEANHAYQRQRQGTIVAVGTQRHFHSSIHNLISSMRYNPKLCSRSSMANVDRHFSPPFHIDWCKTTARNVTLIREFADEELEKEFRNQQAVQLDISPEGAAAAKQDAPLLLDHGFSFWESFIIFPLIGAICVIAIIVLCSIFLGGREGQQWRDYKTPPEQLEEYASVRESQRKLRALSVQRQILQRADEKADSMAPSDIHTFLQPKAVPRSASSQKGSRNPIYKSRSRLTDRDLDPSPSDNIPLGKQTVADAARQVGSSLHLYRNPLDMTESDNDEKEEDPAEKDSLEDAPPLV